MRTSSGTSTLSGQARRRSLQAALAVTLGMSTAACGQEKIEGDPVYPDTETPDTETPDTETPDTTEPDTTEPDVTEPDTTEPDTTEPDVTEPDADEPDTTEPDVTEPDADEPDTDLPDTDEPPDADEPDIDEPDGDEVHACLLEQDNVCPEGCSVDEDYDCCMDQNNESTFCSFDTSSGGCGCAVQGPFAPPSLELR